MCFDELSKKKCCLSDSSLKQRAKASKQLCHVDYWPRNKALITDFSCMKKA